MPEELIVEIDEAARLQLLSRSEYIRRVLYRDVHGKHPDAIKKALERDRWQFLDLDDS